MVEKLKKYLMATVYGSDGPTTETEMVECEYGEFFKVRDVEPILNSLQQPKAEICSMCGYFPCANRKQFEGTVITHCTQYYKLSAV